MENLPQTKNQNETPVIPDKCPECKKEVTEQNWVESLLQSCCYNCFWGYPEPITEEEIMEDYLSGKRKTKARNKD